MLLCPFPNSPKRPPRQTFQPQKASSKAFSYNPFPHSGLSRLHFSNPCQKRSSFVCVCVCVCVYHIGDINRHKSKQKEKKKSFFLSFFFVRLELQNFAAFGNRLHKLSLAQRSARGSSISSWVTLATNKQKHSILRTRLRRSSPPWPAVRGRYLVLSTYYAPSRGDRWQNWQLFHHR